MNSLEIENGMRYIYSIDYRLAKIIDNYGKCNLKPKKSYFIAILRAIIGQQLSVKAASSINYKFISFFDGNPVPEKIINEQDQVLRSLGLSNAKVRYVKDLCEKILNNEISLKRIAEKNDEEIIKELVKVKGIGKWTVHMFLIFTLGRPNVLPVSDLGIRKAIMLNYNLRSLPDERKVENISNKNNWAPYNSIASWYLWKSLNMNIAF